MEELFSNKLDPRLTKNVQISNVQKEIEGRKQLADKILSLPQVLIDRCNICGNSDQSNVALESKKFVWIRCPDCTHIYRKYIPDYNELAKFFTNETIEVYLDESSFEYRLENITQRKYDFMMRYRDGKPGRWLDLATGIADMPHLLQRENWDFDATELNNAFIKFASKHFGITPKAMLLPEYYEHFKAEKMKPFDVISAFGYYDMLPNPVEHCKLVNKMLKLGGLHGINLPNSRSLSGALVEFRPDSSLRQATPVNISYFTYKSIKRMLTMAGFEMVGVLWHGLDIHELITRIVELDSSFKDSKAYTFLYDNFNTLQEVVDLERMSDLLLLCARKVREAD